MGEEFSHAAQPSFPDLGHETRRARSRIFGQRLFFNSFGADPRRSNLLHDSFETESLFRRLLHDSFLTESRRGGSCAACMETKLGAAKFFPTALALKLCSAGPKLSAFELNPGAAGSCTTAFWMLQRYARGSLLRKRRIAGMASNRRFTSDARGAPPAENELLPHGFPTSLRQ